ncbi:MAG: glycosyltransferase [Deltaproteobacteria bacterium]|jgi:glycosyltransferase involved in cell wall biosynthesis|nr:glycosyltransferase [Deltaproteobacteria bacterium]
MSHGIFFTQGVRTPSARFRVEQHLPYFERSGVRCTLRPANPSNQGELASYSPPMGLRRELLRLAATPARAMQLRGLSGFDFAFIQKPLIFFPYTGFEAWVARRLPTVFDMDDAIHLKHRGLGARQVRRIVDVVDHVIVGNDHLAEIVDEPGKTTVIPTVVDHLRFALRPVPDDPFTVVWTGLSDNMREIEPYADVLRRVLGEVGGRLVLISERFDAPWIRGLSVETIPWSPEAEVAGLSLGHVGLMPLADTPFNRGKCGFKLIQYMARGIPAIASPVGTNPQIIEHGVNGMLAATPSEMEEALMAMARDPGFAASLAAEARRTVVERYSVQAVLPRYLEIFEGLVGKSLARG